MSQIDRQRIEAVKTLQGLAYDFVEGTWCPPASAAAPKPDAVADALHGLLVQRADQLEGCAEGSAEEMELAAIAVAVEAYESIRWPEGR
jgi:hypothetical protein